jgi:hypothetical protein
MRAFFSASISDVFSVAASRRRRKSFSSLTVLSSTAEIWAGQSDIKTEKGKIFPVHRIFILCAACRYSLKPREDAQLEKNVSSVEVAAERDELLRALGEFEFWYSDRVDRFRKLQSDIQKGLRSGRITECRKEGTGKRYLTQRMIATLGVDHKLGLRVLLMMNIRKRQMETRLGELNRLLGESVGTVAAEPEDDKSDGTQELEISA